MEEDHGRAKELRGTAKTALQRRQWARACELLDEAIELDPNCHPLYRLRIIASAGLGDFASALEDAEVLLDLHPSPDAHCFKAHALYHLRDFAAAARAFQQGLKASPHDKMLHQGYWDSLTMLRQEQQAPAAAGDHAQAPGGGGGKAGAGGGPAGAAGALASPWRLDAFEG